jgi:4a-hydroxytetrahydrobiopterin dehydratase
MQNTISPEKLTSKKCSACEGGVEKIAPAQAQTLLKALDGWRIVDEGRRIRKEWEMKDFMTGIAFFNSVANIAEAEGHHPDLHLEGYRHVQIELWTHSIGGLSENDFIMAAKIDQLK